jgi:hypothetical protein
MPDLLHTAILNKIGLFYLEYLEKFGRIGNYAFELSVLRKKRLRLFALASFLSDLFKENGISYCIMKTLRPFPYAGADVDVIVRTQVGFSNAVMLLLKYDFTLLGYDLFSATLYRADFDLNVDLQLEISVSGLPYLDKNILLSYVSKVTINDVDTIILDACAEVIVIACHSFYKEHMFTLSDFYTITMLITRENYRELCMLAEKTNSKAAVGVLLFWIQNVAKEVLQINLPGFDEALSSLNDHTFTPMINLKSLDFPLKFSKSFVAATLVHKLMVDNNARSSITRAFQSSFSRKQFQAALRHFRRESY